MKKTLLLAACALVASGAMFAKHPAAAMDMPTAAGAALNVSDLDRSEKFYTEVMGLKVLNTMHVPQGTEIIMTSPGAARPMVVITNFKGQKPGRETFGRLIFTMADPAPFIKHVKDTGIEVQSAGAPDGKGPQVYFLHDPDGFQIEVFQAMAPAGH